MEERRTCRHAVKATILLALSTTLDARVEIDAASPWLDGESPSPAALELRDAVRDIERHGLDPAHYGLDVLDPLFDTTADRLDADARERLVTTADSAFKRLVSDLGAGAVVARDVQRLNFRDRLEVDADAALADVASGERTVAATLDALQPGHRIYRGLVDWMDALLDERARGVARTRVPDLSLAVGDHGTAVLALRQRLVETGDLSYEEAASSWFDAPLVLALQAFQARHGLALTTGVDEETLTALNRSVGDEIAELALNLERWRWLPRELGERHLLVNVPDFKLHVYNGDQRIVDMRTVVGAPQHQTPNFSNQLRFIEINPTWTVPRSITVNELLPIERRKPGYLASRNFRYKRWEGNRLVDVHPADVSPRAAFLRPFPYVLQQQPDERNALGRLKFMFPNPYSIYMHDTPAKPLFAKRVRAFSHGCVRLADPERLASLLLQIDGMSHDEARWLIDRRGNHQQFLETALPVHIAYYTAWVDEDGRRQWRPDIYGHNPGLAEALAQQAAPVFTLASHP